jgi:putative two-component system response regulator
MGNARIMIVDDQEPNIRLLTQILGRHGYGNIAGYTAASRALEAFGEQEPDLVLLDLHMPDHDGFDVLAKIRSRAPAIHGLPVLVLTADVTSEAKLTALDRGASDFLTKPFDPAEVLLRIRNLLTTRALHLEVQRSIDLLELRVRERTSELEAAQVEVAQRLARAAEFRDDDTGQHTYRVGRLSALLARECGLSEWRVELINLAAPLHDVGKIGIPDAVLLKPGKLDPDEFALMKRHTTIGAQLLADGRSELLQLARKIALTHHERWDGNGYPDGSGGQDIPLEGRIVAIIDVFDALTHTRPYKPAWPLEKGLETIGEGAGSAFDPALVDAFGRLADGRSLAEIEVLSP